MDNIENLLQRLTPRGLGADMRPRVLETMRAELRDRRLSLGGCEEMGTGSEPQWESSGKTACREVPVPISSRPFRESSAPSPWLRRCGLATAASILVGVALNVWASKASQRHLAALFGPPPISQRAMEIAKDIERITDAETGQWVYRRLTAARANRDASADYARYLATVNRLIKELQTVSRDSYHETLEKDPEMDRDRARRAGGDRTSGQRLVRLDHRYTA